MANNKRLRVAVRKGEAMKVTRVTVGQDKLVYVLRADRAHRYPHGRSHVVYIGTTKNGVSRVASSVAAKSETILRTHGVRELHARIVTCHRRQRVKTWEKMERALLVTFREMYGDLPRFNKKAGGEGDVFDYFSRQRIRTILEQMA